MDIKNKIAFILFCSFLMAYVLKLLVLYRKNKIKANVLAKVNKNPAIRQTELFVKITTFLWGFTWLLFSLFEGGIEDFAHTVVVNVIVGYIGLLILSLGLLTFIIAMTTMKTSWRVGIDQQHMSSLIIEGIYKFSRNPAFVGFDLMFLGLFVTYPNIVTLSIAILNFIAIHRLILQEEKHLQSVFGNEYNKYKSKTPRYIFFSEVLTMKRLSSYVKYRLCKKP